MATKAELITRLEVLSGVLGRDLDTSGSIADLELRVREAEEEVGDVTESPVVNGSGAGADIDDTSTRKDTLAEDDASEFVTVKALKTVTLTVKNKAGRWRSEIVAAGREVELQWKNYHSLPHGLVSRVG